jgi:hypothetical protein
MLDKEYIEMMGHLDDLQPYVLLTTGRTGSDFLQSLMDSHTEVLTFNGILFFHDFWSNSKCNKTHPINLLDLLNEFIGMNIEKFKSKYDYLEQKDRLGDDGSQSININLSLFRESSIGLLINKEISSRNFMLAIYGAYAISLGQKIKNKTIILHHLHHVHRLPNYLLDFPNSKIISMTRDPRANFVSGILHHRKYNIETDNASHIFFYINRIIVDSYAINHLDNEYITIRVEDLGEKCILESLCKWLGIEYENTLQNSTWAGMKWRGDRVSVKSNKTAGFSKEMLENAWEKKLSFLDQYLLNFLLNDRLRHYKYKYKKIYFYDYFFAFFLILLPLRFEIKYFSYKYLADKIIKNEYKVLVINCIYYPLRVYSFYKVMFKKIIGFKFNRKYLSCNKDI